ncbi:MAG TPA: imidazolonepropionase [Stenomitos sp.]
MERVDLIVRNAAQLVTVAGPAAPRAGAEQGMLDIIPDGAIAISGGEIVMVGTTDEVMTQVPIDSETIEVDARGSVVTPGLIDSHTHLVFAGTRQHEFELRAKGASYAQIHEEGGGIYSSVRKTREASRLELIRNAEHHLQVMLSHGTTTVEAKSGYGLDFDTELKQLEALMEVGRRHPIDVVPTYMGAHAVPQGEDPDAYVEWLCSEAIPRIAMRSVARFCDVFCEKGVFTVEQSERILRAALKHGMEAKLHADELADTGGAALAAKVGAVSADHLHCANEEGLTAMARAGVVGTLLPGTAVFLGMREHAPARRMIELGVPVALATDFNPGSCYSESLPLMMSFACTQMKLTPAEALVAATINAAHAVSRSHRIGSLEIGKQADLVLWDADDYRMIPYHMGINLVKTVIKRGQVVHRIPWVATRPVMEAGA